MLASQRVGKSAGQQVMNQSLLTDMRRDRVLVFLMRLGFFFVAFNTVRILVNWSGHAEVIRVTSDVLAILGGIVGLTIFSIRRQKNSN
jgi:hypothetical protein